MQPGDVQATWADTQALFDATGYRARVGQKGVASRRLVQGLLRGLTHIIQMKGLPVAAPFYPVPASGPGA